MAGSSGRRVWIPRPDGVTRPMSRRSRVCGLLALVLCFGTPGRPAQAAAGEWEGDDRVAARLIAATDHVGGGDVVDAGIAFRVAPGWHIYWRTPGEAALPPTVDWAGSANMSGGVIAWPFPTRAIIGGLQNNIYPGPVVLPVTVRLFHPAEPVQLHAHLSYAACGEVCVPYVVDLTLTLPAGPASPAPEAPLIAAARAQVPGALTDIGVALEGLSLSSSSAGLHLDIVLRPAGAAFAAPDVFVEGAGNLAIPNVQLRADGHVADVHVTLPAGASGTSGVCLTLVDRGRAAAFWAGPLSATRPLDRHSPC
jgi:suppressor for copper-sensitivity B